jgi:N-methylhydantoinase A/oxoprolinase/acetone carboxylase beta subunit
MKVRIGIDVGGTFTDAVALNNDTYELVGATKIPTTHTSDSGVAAGIIEALHQLMEETGIQPEDVVFIAHGTTQATNALLEGDVAPVGILGFWSGLEGIKAKADTRIGRIELAPGKFLSTSNSYVEVREGSDPPLGTIDAAVAELAASGAEAIVAAEAFSVDNDRNESVGVERSERVGIPATATNDVSKLYGLKVRTRTAVVNASILPRMLETANLTEKSIKDAAIAAPLMVMRCDGGVMTVGEVRRRPILTILSGPAAGVAGALMYERLSDGLFFEVGGTSTDISCVRDGQVMVKYAEVGGHKTYLNSLDVRTVGVGGGSMIQLEGGRPVAVGPRSAHIAGVDYEVYHEPLADPVLDVVSPFPGDPTYAVVRSADGVVCGLTLSGAANIAGYVQDGDYARGDVEAARQAWAPLAAAMGCSVEQAASTVLDLAAEKNAKVARELMRDYRMNPATTVFAGGGGGASTVVPHLAERMSARWKTAKNAPVISPIGVALALVRETVERTIINPTQQDILAVRNEAEAQAIKLGAAPGTVEVTVDVDPQKNLVSAVATGATELRSKDRNQTPLPPAELRAICVDNLGLDPDVVNELASSDGLHVYQGTAPRKRLFGLIPRPALSPVRVIDDFGVIRLQRSSGEAIQTTVGGWKSAARAVVEKHTAYDDGGASLPNVHLICGQRIVDLSGMQDVDQVISLGDVEMMHFNSGEPMVVLVSGRSD